MSLYHTNAQMHHFKALFNKNLVKEGSTLIYLKDSSCNT